MDFWCSQKSASEKRIRPSTSPLLIQVRADLWVFLAKAKRKRGGFDHINYLIWLISYIQSQKENVSRTVWPDV
jgi:hypothetical protein